MGVYQKRVAGGSAVITGVWHQCAGCRRRRQCGHLTGGNFYESKPEVGIYDASYGSLLKGDGKGNFVAVNEKQSGYMVKGQVRDIAQIRTGKKMLAIFAMNNEAPVIFSIDKRVKK